MLTGANLPELSYLKNCASVRRLLTDAQEQPQAAASGVHAAKPALRTNHASTDKKDRTAPVNLAYRVSVFSIGPEGRFAFLQSEDRPLSRKCSRNSILRRHIRVLLESPHLEDRRIMLPRTGLTIRNPQYYPFFEIIFSIRNR
jgi:hypothetical protein